MSTYTSIIKPVLFKQDPERVHNSITKIGVLLGKTPVTRAILRSMFYFRHHALECQVAGIDFDNPIGLAAGFDKNAQMYNIFPEIGFGFAELGSITGEPCAGNPKPRLFRVPNEKSIIVNYGLCNEGCEVIAERLKDVHFKIPIGLSIARTNNPSLTIEQGIQDYRKAYKTMHPLGSYTTINVSCPNTPDDQAFGNPRNMASLLNVLAKEKHLRPVFVKIKPDYTMSELQEIIDIVEKHEWITGFILTNLTKQREGLATSKKELDKISPKGGLSGLPTQEKSKETLKQVHKRTHKILIGCGGTFTGKDAYDKIKNGASLIQLVTALIYEGPGVISRINKELVNLIQKDGFGSIREVIRARS
ncbi:MAG: quinone-dependent dihydroorotate dehydrogenase, partial [Nanoarchaeota archaeon]